MMPSETVGLGFVIPGLTGNPLFKVHSDLGFHEASENFPNATCDEINRRRR
jgi:hypothetical protein